MKIADGSMASTILSSEKVFRLVANMAGATVEVKDHPRSGGKNVWSSYTELGKGWWISATPADIAPETYLVAWFQDEKKMLAFARMLGLRKNS